MSKEDEELGVVSSPPPTKTPKEIEEYWTPERMKEAKPVPMPTPPQHDK